MGKFVKNMSAYNWFVKQNIAKAESEDTKIKDLMLSFGSLTPPSFVADDVAMAGQGLNVENLVAPAVPAGHKCMAIIGICTPDAATSSYAIKEASVGPAKTTVTAPLVLEFEGEIFITVFFADVTDYGTASQKVWAVSNSATLKHTV